MAVSKSSNNLTTLSNSALLARASTVIPGGVNSPVRAFGGVGGTPLFISHGNGPYIYSQSGQQYIDYIGSWGPLILGHADGDVCLAVKQAVDKSLGFGAPTLLEIELAEKITSLMPNIEKIRMVNSGTEATMTAIRLARGYTKKDKIIKFIGCYHGHSDSLLVRAGSGLLTHSVQNNTASSAGVPAAVVQDTLLADFNDLDSVAALFAAYKDNIAAIIVEPIPGNMNMILPKPEFLHGLRDLCTQYHSVLIFDEVMSGFRVDLGGAQALYNVKPDLTTLGKVIGGGLPVGAFGGLAKIMDCLSPLGDVYQAGTLSGNPIAMTAGLATLNKISSNPDFFKDLSFKTNYLITELSKLMSRYNVPFHAHSVGGMFGVFFLSNVEAGKTLDNFDAVTRCDLSFFKQFFHAMLEVGVYFAPSAFEAGFVSVAHSMEVINKTIKAAEQGLKAIL